MSGAFALFYQQTYSIVSVFITYILLTGVPIGFEEKNGGFVGLGVLGGPGLDLGARYSPPRRATDVLVFNMGKKQKLF